MTSKTQTRLGLGIKDLKVELSQMKTSLGNAQQRFCGSFRCKTCFSVCCLTAKLPEPTTAGPQEDPDTPTPGSWTVPPLTQMPAQPQQAELQAGAAEPTKHPRTESRPTSPHTTSPPTTFDDYDVKNFDNPLLESIPIPLRGDTISLPPLPKFEPQPPKLDVSHGGGIGALVNSSIDAPPDGSLQSTNLELSWSPKTTAEETSRPEGTIELDPASFSVEPGHQPAVVFKEHLSSEAPPEPDSDQSGAVPAGPDPFDQTSLHIIIVNMPSSNHSGRGGV